MFAEATAAAAAAADDARRVGVDGRELVRVAAAAVELVLGAMEPI